MRDYSQADFDAIADELNGRPRQTLGFKTPSQALATVLRCPPEPAGMSVRVGDRFCPRLSPPQWVVPSS
jgi:hypothetical protein